MKNMDNLCMRCMSDLKNENICPKCGEKKGEPQLTPFLPKKTILGSRYVIGAGLEINGEGLSYIGYDNVKETKIYIREFFPENLCIRREDFTNVMAYSYKKSLFEKELEKFLKYFRSVARLRNIPAICAIYDIFKENGTAYIIIEWVEGMRLDKFVSEKGGKLSWDEARPMFIPLISSLNKMHGARVLHLGISPKNIFVEPNGKMKLTGFAIDDLRKLNSPIEAQLYDGCSALEQYIDIYDMDQSTDVYGLTATLFLTLTGEYPQTATKRKKDDRLLMPRDVVRIIPDNVISGIASGLRVYPNNRTLSFERLKVEISGSNLAALSFTKEEKIDFKKDNKKNKNFILGLISCLVALVILGLCFIFYWFIFRNNNQQSQNNASSEGLNTNETLEEIENKEKILIPNLKGKKFEELKSQSKDSVGYEVLMLSEEFNDNIDQGYVISQTPGEGEEAYEGAIIAVNISKGSKMRKLPNIKGKTISEAALAVSAAGLIPVESWESSADIPEGYVVGYANNKEGDMVEYNSEVVIVRSSVS